jgi:hypothetical protein
MTSGQRNLSRRAFVGGATTLSALCAGGIALPAFLMAASFAIAKKPVSALQFEMPCLY